MALLFSFPQYDDLADKYIQHSGDIKGQLVYRHFPDGECYLQILSDVRGQEVKILCSLDQPDSKALALMFFAQTAKELGATKVGLIAPYLGYMRQDKRFNEGEAITSQIFARFISKYFDSLLTIDPHLHRRKSLDEIYPIPTKTLHATGLIADWIKENVKNPLIIGPDAESQQWIAAIAEQTKAPYRILHKNRLGDSEVEVTVPNVEGLKNLTPVLVDDIISTAMTMIQAVHHLKTLKMKPAICIGIHAIFANQSDQALKETGVARIITCNTIPHPTNEIDVSGLMIR